MFAVEIKGLSCNERAAGARHRRLRSTLSNRRGERGGIVPACQAKHSPAGRYGWGEELSKKARIKQTNQESEGP